VLWWESKPGRAGFICVYDYDYYYVKNYSEFVAPKYMQGSVCIGAVLQIGRSLVRSKLVSMDFSLTYNPSDRTMALGST
jgi:hypothetical protein